MVKRMIAKKVLPSLMCYFDIFFQILLFVVFLIFFGFPSVKKYLDQETIIIKSEEETNGIEAPVITILAMKNFFGWKSKQNVTDTRMELFEMVDHCKEVGIADIKSCISQDTYELDDFIAMASIGAMDQRKFVDKSMWIEDMTSTKFGRQFTLKLSRKLTRN